MFRTLLVAALLVAAGCRSPGPRGYYRPLGAAPQETLSSYVEQRTEALIEARCQGAYEDTVEGVRTGTVHIQLDVARRRSGDMILPRDALRVQIPPASGAGEPLQLQLSEAWSGRNHVEGDLLVPAWTRRPFDLFFDSPDLFAHGPPASLRLVWQLREGADVHDGSCDFTLIPDDDRFSPAKLPPADARFGLRNGYYLPGVRLGERELRAQGEERMHYIYHAPEGWWW
jgi:hypothetical protein